MQVIAALNHSFLVLIYKLRHCTRHFKHEKATNYTRYVVLLKKHIIRICNNE